MYVCVHLHVHACTCMGAHAGQKQVRAGIPGDCELPDVVIEKVPRSSGRETSALNIVSDNQFFTIV